MSLRPPISASAARASPAASSSKRQLARSYAIAWTSKMTRKFAGLQDYKVCFLEGLYWERCDWQMLIRVPDFITKAEIKKAADALIAKGKPDAVRQVELVKLTEGRCAQVLQVGPYSTAPQTIDALQAFAAEHGCEMTANCHEIYLNDPRRVAPEKLKTIIRISLRKIPRKSAA